MSLIRKHVAVLQAWACLAFVLFHEKITSGPMSGLVLNITRPRSSRERVSKL